MIELLKKCPNGAIPGKKLDQALLAVHKSKPLSTSTTWDLGSAEDLSQCIRQLFSKIRRCKEAEMPLGPLSWWKYACCWDIWKTDDSHFPKLNVVAWALQFFKVWEFPIFESWNLNVTYKTYTDNCHCQKKAWKDVAKSNYGAAAVHGGASCSLPVQGRFKGDRFNMQVVSPGLRHFLCILSVLNWWIWGSQRFNGFPLGRPRRPAGHRNSCVMFFIDIVLLYYSYQSFISDEVEPAEALHLPDFSSLLKAMIWWCNQVLMIYWSYMSFFCVTTIGFFMWMPRNQIKERPHPPCKQKSQYQSRTNS